VYRFQNQSQLINQILRLYVHFCASFRSIFSSFFKSSNLLAMNVSFPQPAFLLCDLYLLFLLSLLSITLLSTLFISHIIVFRMTISNVDSFSVIIVIIVTTNTEICSIRIAKNWINRNVFHSLQRYMVEKFNCSVLLDFVQGSPKNIIFRVFWKNTFAQ